MIYQLDNVNTINHLYELAFGLWNLIISLMCVRRMQRFFLQFKNRQIFKHVLTLHNEI